MQLDLDDDEGSGEGVGWGGHKRNLTESIFTISLLTFIAIKTENINFLVKPKTLSK